MALFMLVSTTPAYATEADKDYDNNQSQEVMMCYSDGEGRTLTNIDGEVYEVVDATPENTTVVTDPHIIAQLEGRAARAGYPLFDINNAHSMPWSGNINLNRNSITYNSPTLNRGNNRTTIVKFDEGGHYWFNYYFHDFTTDKWTLLGISDVKYSGVAVRDWYYQHGGYPGNSIDYCQLVFISAYDDSFGNIGAAKSSSFGVKVGVGNVF